MFCVWSLGFKVHCYEILGLRVICIKIVESIEQKLPVLFGVAAKLSKFRFIYLTNEYSPPVNKV